VGQIQDQIAKCYGTPIYQLDRERTLFDRPNCVLGLWPKSRPQIPTAIGGLGHSEQIVDVSNPGVHFIGADGPWRPERSFSAPQIDGLQRSQPAAPNFAGSTDRAHTRLCQIFGLGILHPAFDGANIWVVNNNNSGTVSKIRVSDGALLGTFSTGGAQPYAAAFDGANIWVTNALSGTVSKIRAADGANLGTFATGANADGVAFDGSNIWVANAFSNTLSKIRAADGVTLGTFPTGANPAGVAFDGVNIWVPNNFGDSVSKY